MDVVRIIPQRRDLEYRDIQKMEYELEGEVKKLIQNGIPYLTHLILSDQSPGKELVQYAQENRICEIIMGLKRKSKVGKLISGSTTQFVILHAP